MARLVLHPFRYYDIRTRKWWRARYVAEILEIAERYAAFQVIGQPEIREGGDDPRIISEAHRRDR